MPNGGLDDRRKSLEEAFFRKENEKLRARIEAEREREATRKALAGEAGIDDDALLDRLVELGIRVDTVEALVLVPLVMVAWADGRIDPDERAAVLRGAEAGGFTPDKPAYALLEAWTKERPPADLMTSWRSYIGALVKELSADQRAALEGRIVARAREVARASGGFLGFSKISAEEEAVLKELEQAFENPIVGR
jgi:tellurite resistance protein